MFVALVHARAVDDAASDEGGTRFAMETDFGIDLGMEMKRMQLPTQTQLTTHRKLRANINHKYARHALR